MNHAFTILADGFPPGLIFVAIFIVFVLVNVFSAKAKPTTPPPLSADELERRARANEARRRYLAEQQARRGHRGETPPPMPAQQQPQRDAKKPRRPAAAKSQQPAVQAVVRPVAKPIAARPIVVERPQAEPVETTRNVRLMLRRGAAREAVILTEILGKPMSLRDHT